MESIEGKGEKLNSKLMFLQPLLDTQESCQGLRLRGHAVWRVNGFGLGIWPLLSLGLFGMRSPVQLETEHWNPGWLLVLGNGLRGAKDADTFLFAQLGGLIPEDVLDFELDASDQFLDGDGLAVVTEVGTAPVVCPGFKEGAVVSSEPSADQSQLRSYLDEAVENGEVAFFPETLMEMGEVIPGGQMLTLKPGKASQAGPFGAVSNLVAQTLDIGDTFQPCRQFQVDKT